MIECDKSWTLFSCKVLEEVKVKQAMDRDILMNVARTSLRTKVHQELADLLTEVQYLIVIRRQISSEYSFILVLTLLMTSLHAWYVNVVDSRSSLCEEWKLFLWE